MAQISTPERPQLFTTDRHKVTPGQPRKRSNATAIIFGSLVVLLLVVGIARMAMSKPDPASMNRTRVVGALRDILPGTTIGFGDIRYMDIPNDYLSEGMFARTNLVVGRVSKVYIPERNPLSNNMLYESGKTMASELETHERAVTVKLNEAAMVDHQLVPGDKVDVLVTAVKDGKRYTKTICQNVKVLMSSTRAMVTSQIASRAGDLSKRITLALTPDQAEIVTHAEESGHIKLALRSRLSIVESKLPGVSEMDLLPDKAMSPQFGSQTNSSLNIPAPPPEPSGFLPDLPAPPPLESALPPVVKDSVKWVVEMFSGSKKELYEVPATSQ
ncbi:MAG: Flp pilus assembly protein CpaB [Candidatus Obscuribacterales bacterium]